MPWEYSLYSVFNDRLFHVGLVNRVTFCAQALRRGIARCAASSKEEGSRSGSPLCSIGKAPPE